VLPPDEPHLKLIKFPEDLYYRQLSTPQEKKPMEKYSFQKNWYKSQRLGVLIVTAILLVSNDMFGLKLDESTVQWVVGLAMSFIAGKSIQDALSSQAEVKAKAFLESGKQDPTPPV